ncbi:MAG: PLP-dependent aminotransferase family protein [Rhizomicrobium sp.]|nr:PLP-dependent aminotransferase family protein [Rhizomicrobium sp.]
MNLPLQLDRSAAVPLQDQLFEQLRQLILTGRLKPNTRVIATRFLAEQVGVSRRTVLFAYERLISEGYLEARPAIGTFVSAIPPKQAKPVSAASPLVDTPRQATLHPAKHDNPVPPRVADWHIDFSLSQPDTGALLAPKNWLRWMREVADPDIFLKQEAGAHSLRQVIATYVAATRGILAAPEQIVIVTGRRHACTLMAELFQHHGDRVVVELPGEASIAALFRARHAAVVGVPVDALGLQTGHLPQGPVAMAYVTPTRQNPLGGVMPQARRTSLIEWARGAGAYLLEDDSDCDLRYHGQALPPLATLDPYGLVFYLGSFSKTLGAGLSLGYLVVPPEFATPIVAAKALGPEEGQWFEQLVVSNLLASGAYDHHLRRLRKFYLERRDGLIAALRHTFGSVQLLGTESGTQLTWILPDQMGSAAQACAAARAQGVNLEGITDPAAESCPFYDRALLFSYAALTAEQMQQGVLLLARALRP